MGFVGLVLCLMFLAVVGPAPAAAAPCERPRLEQADAWLLWDDPVELHATSTYEATITSVVGGRPVRRVQPVQPVCGSECQVMAALKGEAWTEQTLCAELCEPLGEMTVTVTASTPGWASPSEASNAAHAALTQRCGPEPAPRPPPPPPSQEKLPSWAIGAGAAVGASALAAGTSVSLPTLVNPKCVQWKILGPCLCNPTTPCLQVEYFEPTYLMEVVKQPGTTAIPILGDILKVGLSTLGISLFGGGGAGSSAGAGYTNLHYSEVHVWSFPQIFGGPCTKCAPVNALPRLLYSSEADTASWRMTTAPVGLPPFAQLPVGTWGPLFPRVGFAIHNSPPVASGLKAFRALSVAFMPVTGPPTPEAHVILNPATDITACMQLAWPKQTPCLLAGTPVTPATPWDAGASSMNGTYVWISWSKRVCCVEPPGTCGLTIPPLGLSGENWCPM